ncbi:hypothetical protein ACWJJH_07485 [Endozoicomonadaceae bacterium StTr2]
MQIHFIHSRKPPQSQHHKAIISNTQLFSGLLSVRLLNLVYTKRQSIQTPLPLNSAVIMPLYNTGHFLQYFPTGVRTANNTIPGTMLRQHDILKLFQPYILVQGMRPACYRKQGWCIHLPHIHQRINPGLSRMKGKIIYLLQALGKLVYWKESDAL